MDRVENCEFCGRVYNKTVLKRCPVCRAGREAKTSLDSSSERIPVTEVSKLIEELSSNQTSTRNKSPEAREAANVARSSSVIVGAYGNYIQIYGAIMAALASSSFLFTLWNTYNKALVIVGSIVVGIFTIIPALILGAQYKMFSNYIRFRTSEYLER